MARSDFIADTLTMIRNAVRARKEKVTVPASNITIRIVEILKEEGFVSQVRVFQEGKKRFIRLHLKYLRGKKSAIQGIRRISRPGLRHYVGYEAIPRVRGGLGIAIISTSKGVFSDRAARENKVGGEILCNVW